MTIIYVHIHIPKNAGMTFNTILRRQFGRQYARVPEPRPGYIMSMDEKRAWLRQHPRIMCVSGHAFRYPAPAQWGRQYRYLTFLREPVARLISLYAYERKHSAGTDHSSQGPIEAWIEHRLSEKNALENFQTMHLLGVPTADRLSLVRAKRLIGRFFFVGITEEYDRSLALLAHRAGLDPDDLRYERVNVTHSEKLFPVSSATRQRLLDLNQLDAQLYEYARKKLAADMERLAAGAHRPQAASGQNGPEPGWWRQLVSRIRK